MSDRITTVHHRYHITGYLEAQDVGELVETETSRKRAWETARQYIGPRGFDRVEVFDSMAQRGKPELWSVQKNGQANVLRRKPRATDDDRAPHAEDAANESGYPEDAHWSAQ